MKYIVAVVHVDSDDGNVVARHSDRLDWAIRSHLEECGLRVSKAESVVMDFPPEFMFGPAGN